MYQLRQEIRQLEPRKGAYFYFELEADLVLSLEKQRNSRLICEIGKVAWSCGLNHLGNGNFFIIISKKNLAAAGLRVGDVVDFKVLLDPNPLGVGVPEFLTALLAQDQAASHIWENLTDGKKRSLIYSTGKIKNLDLAVEKTIDFLELERRKLKKKGLI